MKLDLSLYDKIFENRVRLQIMSILAANEEYDFSSLKEEYIIVEKSFVDRKPNTRYKRTDKGLKAFENHLIALENLIKQQYK